MKTMYVAVKSLSGDPIIKALTHCQDTDEESKSKDGGSAFFNTFEEAKDWVKEYRTLHIQALQEELVEAGENLRLAEDFVLV